MRLKEIRTEKNIEQKALAAKIGTDAPTLSKIENYKFLPIPEMANKIMEALECTISDIYLPNEVLTYPIAKPKKKKRKSGVYRLTAEIPSEAKKFLHSGALQECGFADITAWINWCYSELKRMYATKKDPMKSSHEVKRDTE